MIATTKLKKWGIRLAVVAAASALYINWPALNGRECSGFSRTRDAYTIKYYIPLILKKAEQGRLHAAAQGGDVPSAEDFRAVLSMALKYFAQCTAERGLDRCMLVGTDPTKLFFIEESKGGPSEADWHKYQYIVPKKSGNHDFSLSFWPSWRWDPYEHWISIEYDRDWYIDIYLRKFERCNQNPDGRYLIVSAVKPAVY